MGSLGLPSLGLLLPTRCDEHDDQVDEFVLVVSAQACVYGLKSGVWRGLGTLRSGSSASGSELAAQIAAGNVRVEEPAWRELIIGRHTFRMNGT